MTTDHSSIYNELADFITSLPTLEQWINYHPSAAFQSRMGDLLEKNRNGQLTDGEQAELRDYDVVEKLMRRAKIAARQKLAQQDVQTALATLRSSSLAARLSAQTALADTGAPAVDGLLALLRDAAAPDEARWRAAMALGALAARLSDDPRPADALIETFQRDRVMEVRDLITWTLGEAGLPRLFAPLQEAYNALEDTDLIAYNAALALARIDRPRALALFQADVNSPHEPVYRVALSALAALNS